MARKTHSLNTRKIVFGKAKPTHIKDVRMDRDNRKIKFDKGGDPTHPMGWNIHHKDSNPINNQVNNLEAVNYKTHERLNRENK